MVNTGFINTDTMSVGHWFTTYVTRRDIEYYHIGQLAYVGMAYRSYVNNGFTG